jgi:hypothetical protein
MSATTKRDRSPRPSDRSTRGTAADAATSVTLLPDGSPACPACGGRMWDNRENKRNPRAPDFKCRDRDCAGRLWPGQFKGTLTDDAAVAAPAHAEDATPEAPSNVRPVEDQVTGRAGQGGTDEGPLAAAVRAVVGETLRACYLDVTDFVLAEVRPKYAAASVPCTDATVAAIAATLFIAQCKGTGTDTSRGGAA